MSVEDVVTCALAREVRPDDVIGVGLGTPTALCAALVAQRTHAGGATVLVGGAVSPRATLAECLHHETDGRTPGFVPHLDTMDMAERISYGEGIEGGEHMRLATFVKPGSTQIQLFQPMSDGFLMLSLIHI